MTSNAANPPLTLRLFVAGEAPNSRKARENLKRLCGRLPHGTANVEIIDVDAEPERALKNHIFVTPALQVLDTSPGTILYGNLSNEQALLDLLQS